MHRHHERDHEMEAKRNRTAALAAAYLLGIGTALLALGGASAGRGFVAAGAAALAAALAALLLARHGRPTVSRRVAGPAVAWAAAPAIGQELPTVNDYYSNAPDGTPPWASSQSPHRCWEPLPPEGLADPASEAHPVVG